MSLTGETIASGAPPRCPDCGVMPRIDVYRSAAGFYLGTAGFYLGTHDRGRQPPAVAAGQVDQPAVGAGRCRLDLELLREHEQPGRVGRVWVACLTDQQGAAYALAERRRDRLQEALLVGVEVLLARRSVEAETAPRRAAATA